jgi:molybdopterin synthase sulfur carrier subunit
MAEVHLPRSLTDLFPGAPRRLELDEPTVAALLRRLDERWPGMWDRLCEAGPAIRPHINIFVDGEKARLETPVESDAVVRVIPAVSGG